MAVVEAAMRLPFSPQKRRVDVMKKEVETARSKHSNDTHTHLGWSGSSAKRGTRRPFSVGRLSFRPSGETQRHPDLLQSVRERTMRR